MARAATTSDAFNAVAEPRRREILNYLALQERPVGEIVDALEMEQPSVSKHLRVLKDVGLVCARCGGDPAFARVGGDVGEVLAAAVDPGEGTGGGEKRRCEEGLKRVLFTFKEE